MHMPVPFVFKRFIGCFLNLSFPKKEGWLFLLLLLLCALCAECLWVYATDALMSATRLATSAVSVSQEHMNRAPPDPMKV